MNKGRKEACSESFLHCFSYALCSAHGEREAAKLMSTIVGVFEACDSLVLIMHRDAKPDNLLFHDPNSCVLPSLHWSAMSR